MEFGYVYETGKRACNEDALFVRSILFSGGEMVIAAVCDGMGGVDAGGEASYFCICEIEDWIDSQLISCVENCRKSRRKLRMAIQAKGYMLFRQINKELFDRMRKEHSQMGTTATIYMEYRDIYYLFHIGDSRCYCIGKRFGKPYFARMTKDHGNDNGLERCLGLNTQWKPDFYEGKCRGGGILLCTDGFWRKKDEELWKSCMETGKMKTAGAIIKRLKSVVQYNMRMGERDNMSAIYLSRGGGI